MGDARSNFLRRKRELAKEIKRQKDSSIDTAVWLLEPTADKSLVYLRCSVCHHIHMMTDKQFERFEFPCMCPECYRYMLSVTTSNRRTNT